MPVTCLLQLFCSSIFETVSLLLSQLQSFIGTLTTKAQIFDSLVLCIEIIRAPCQTWHFLWVLLSELGSLCLHDKGFPVMISPVRISPVYLLTACLFIQKALPQWELTVPMRPELTSPGKAEDAGQQCLQVKAREHSFACSFCVRTHTLDPVLRKEQTNQLLVREGGCRAPHRC